MGTENIGKSFENTEHNGVRDNHKHLCRVHYYVVGNFYQKF